MGVEEQHENQLDQLKRQCKVRRAIAIDMAAHVAEQFQHLPRAELKQRILHLIDMSQMEHDALVIRYRIRDRHGESK